MTEGHSETIKQTLEEAMLIISVAKDSVFDGVKRNQLNDWVNDRTIDRVLEDLLDWIKIEQMKKN